MSQTKDNLFEVKTPFSTGSFLEGSYGIEVGKGKTLVTARAGSAKLSAQGKFVDIAQAERAEVVSAEPPVGPQPAARNLMIGGDFGQGIDPAWQWGNRDEEESLLGSVDVQRVDGRTAVHFLREGSSKHVETYLFQSINKDVTDFQSLKLSLELKLINQSLSGGGWRGSEYPLHVRVRYRDVNGSENTWVKGFYYQNKDALPTHNGKEVINMWTTYGVDLF